jgi:hypothetical protein
VAVGRKRQYDLDFEEVANFLKRNGVFGQADWLDFREENPEIEDFLPKDLSKSLGMLHSTFWSKIRPEGYRREPRPRKAVDKRKKRKKRESGKDFKTLNKMLRFLIEKGITTDSEWDRYVETFGTPEDFPSKPQYYENFNWNLVRSSDWQSHKFMRKKIASYEDLLTFLRNNYIFSSALWLEYIKKNGVPPLFPHNLKENYPELNWDEVRPKSTGPLGKKVYLPYDRFVEYIREKEIYSCTKWVQHRKKNLRTKAKFFPSVPWRSYEEFDWADIRPEGWGEGKSAKTDFPSYSEFLEFMQDKFMTTVRDWGSIWMNVPESRDFPNKPWAHYQEFDWNDFIPKEVREAELKTYEEFVEFARANGIFNIEQWKGYVVKHGFPQGFPPRPWEYYKGEFQWSDISSEVMDRIWTGDEGEDIRQDQWYQDIINPTRVIPEKQPWDEEGLDRLREMTSQKNDNWYKEAQAHFPFYPPAGSDLQGRHGNWDGNLQGQPDFGMIAQQYQNRAIEEMLSRQFNSPIPHDLSQEHDSYELQLRKYTRDDWHLNPELIYEELLRESHVNDGSDYKTMEELLEDTRPKPLMMPIKQASRMVKEATLFGWYNNLEISDGSTIPGMGDRVMAWDDRDESFSEYEGWIKSQPRYNPTYDVKGFYYRWIEPRFKPESWLSYTRDYSNTHPAKRFASSHDLGFIIDTLRKIRTKMLSGDLKATRFICSEDMLAVVGKAMDCCSIDLDIFVLGEMDGEEVYACWIHNGAGSKKIEKVERCIQNNDEHLRDIMENVVGTRSTLSDVVCDVMCATKDIAKEYEIANIYAIGAYARELSLGDSKPEVEELEFTSDSPSDCYKFGYMVAEELGVIPEIDRDRKCLRFNYRGVEVFFNGGKRIASVEKWMHKADIDSSSNIMHDVCNKDFTLNAKAYNPLSGVVTSLFSEDDDSIKTVLKADDIVSFNPFIILRAIYLAVRHHLPIDPKLEAAMDKYAPLLVEKYPVEMLQFAKVRIEELGKEEAQELFKKYELDTILDFGE